MPLVWLHLFHSQPVKYPEQNKKVAPFDRQKHHAVRKTQKPKALASLPGPGHLLYRQQQEWERVMKEQNNGRSTGEDSP